VAPGEDRGIRLNLLEGLVESLPLSLVLVWFSVTGAIMFPVVVCLHHLIWNQIHMEMHKPESRFFSKWAAYRCVARHHYLHHRYPDKNFNVAFPIGDFLFGTIAKATEADWEAMRAEGIA
jgi:sterol desaturase/sphingolipid hydroxylase (fatty acid hydroxylase superfamily)